MVEPNTIWAGICNQQDPNSQSFPGPWRNPIRSFLVVLSVGSTAGDAGQAQTVTIHEWDNPKSQGIIVRPHLEQQIQL